MQCDGRFAVTSDGIPILLANTAAGGGEPEEADNLAANISIYDAVSDDYERFSRRSAVIRRRMIAAAGRVTAGRQAAGELWHLDFGCGPGHVLGWLSSFGLKQVGLDVSLANLRNARRATGCIAICGDATNMPLVHGVFDLVTESSVLHHIQDWRAVLRECLRVCSSRGGVVLDSEPSREQMAWSWLAKAVFAMRFPVYKALSYVRRDKYMFRDLRQARLNLEAEVHHQPGTGFPLEEIVSIFAEAGFAIDVVHSPTPELQSRARPNWKSLVLNGLSFRNPWKAKYGPFTAIALAPRHASGNTSDDDASGADGGAADFDSGASTKARNETGGANPAGHFARRVA